MKTLDTLTQQFYDYHKYDLRSRPNTIKNHQKLQAHFFKLCNIKSFDDITPESIREFKTIKAKQGTDPETVHGYLRSIRALCKWLYQEELVDENIFDPKNGRKKISFPTIDEKPPKLIEREDLHKIRKAVEVYPYYRDHLERLRTKALFSTYMNTAMRKTEVLNLEKTHLKLEERVMLIPKTKTRDFRSVIVNDDLYRDLDEYCDYLKEIKANNTFLFFNSDPRMPMCDNSLRRIKEKIEAFARKRYKIKHFTINWFRHSYITYCQADGLPTSYVMNQAGHKRITTTQRYTHMPKESYKALSEYSILK